jgi:hypothetical protein
MAEALRSASGIVTKRAKVAKTKKGAEQLAGHAAKNGDVSDAKPLAKSTDPAFTKFTTYVRKATHRAVKMRMVGEDRELSDLVEELLSDWLKENGSNED